jgi:hypothetical protein
VLRAPKVCGARTVVVAHGTAQFDTAGTAVIMTTDERRAEYEVLTTGRKTVESW